MKNRIEERCHQGILLTTKVTDVFRSLSVPQASNTSPAPRPCASPDIAVLGGRCYSRAAGAGAPGASENA